MSGEVGLGQPLKGDGLAVGEDTTADRRPVLGWFPVAIEEVGFVGFG